MIEKLRMVRWAIDAIELRTVFDIKQINFGFEGVGFTPGSDIVQVKQIHGTKILSADESSFDRNILPEADGLWSDRKGVRLAIKTADCLPIIVADKNAQMICVIHAGWRGLAAGILHCALELFESYRVPTSETYLMIGPSISLPHYEVGPEVMEAFLNGPRKLKEQDVAFALYKGRADRWQIDLAGLAAMVGVGYGIVPNQIGVVRSCTFQHPEQWNSYRREGRVIASNWTWAEINRTRA